MSISVQLLNHVHVLSPGSAHKGSAPLPQTISTNVKQAADKFQHSAPTIFHHGEVKPGAKMALGEKASFPVLNAKKEVVGYASTQPGTRHQLEVFDGKGGNLSVRIKSPEGVHYLGLPGSKMDVGGAHVSLNGKPMSTNSGAVSTPPKAIKPQTVTTQGWMLGAGVGTRAEPLAGETGFHAKPVLPLVGHQSVASALINQMVQHGVTNVGVNTYFRPDQMKNSIRKEVLPEGNVHFLEEKKLSGTAGPLAKLLMDPKHQGGLDTSKHMLMVQGDAVTDVNFSKLLTQHQKSGALMTIGCQEVPLHDVDKFGIIVTDKSGKDGISGKIQSFQEKPKQAEAKSRLANTGFYLFSPKAWPILKDMAQQHDKNVLEPYRKSGKEVPEKDRLDFGYHIFPQLLKKVADNPKLGSFNAQKTEGYWDDIGNPTQYMKTVHNIMDGKTQLRFPEKSGFEREKGVLFWPGTKDVAKQHGAQLSGNVLVMNPYKK